MIYFIIAVIVFGFAVLVLIGVFGKFKPRHLNQKYFERKWLELLTRVRTQDGMVLAIIDADKLLDDALRRRGFSGKTMGERLVDAQRTLTNNDAVWFAHKLRNRLVHESEARIREREAKAALAAIRQGLKDLGALK
ncbi:hypothetical protein HY380_00585 [Candidatus Saccharibacteria bacterium]|nr:hypothetical protein [Candidatus Saccharibacteria bacterium]